MTEETLKYPLTHAAPAAAQWWGDQIRTVRPEADGLHPGLSNEQAYAAIAQIGLRGQAIDRDAVDDETVAEFVDRLTKLIATSSDSVLTLSVDYGPSRLLAQAAEAAGVPKARFPLKTTLKVWADHVLAKPGYGASWRPVWSSLDWVHPACEVQDWPEGSDDPVGPACGHPRWHAGPHDWQQG